MILLTALTLGCGGDDDGSGSADAAVDAAAQPDAAPAGLMGLGQACAVAMNGADCPANAPACLSFVMGATTGICTAICINNGTFTTDGAAMPGPLMPALSTGDAACPPIFTGTVGIAQCNIVANVMPMGPLAANTDYTFLGVCGITCGAANACPAPLTCNTTAMLCQP